MRVKLPSFLIVFPFLMILEGCKIRSFNSKSSIHSEEQRKFPIGFYTVSNLPAGTISKEMAFKMMDGISRIDEEGNKDCAVIPISKNYSLTALHCLMERTRFEARIFDDLSGQILTIHEPGKALEIEATGGSYPSLFESSTEPARWNLKDEDSYRNSFSNDWAIIRRDNKKLCYSTLAGASEGILTFIGFPIRSYRDGKIVSEGRKKMLSFGDNSLKTPFGNEYFKSLNSEQKNLVERTVGQSMAERSVWVVDGEARPGNSGGPVFDKSGNLLGMVIAGIITPGDGNMYEYKSNSVVILPITTIAKQLRAQKYEVSNYFSCGAVE